MYLWCLWCLLRLHRKKVIWSHPNIVSSVFFSKKKCQSYHCFFFYLTLIYMNLWFKVLWCFTPCWNFKCLSMPYFSDIDDLYNPRAKRWSYVQKWWEAIRHRRSQVLLIFTGSNLNNLYILIPNSISQRSYTMSYPHQLLRTCNVAPFGRNAATKRRWWR